MKNMYKIVCATICVAFIAGNAWCGGEKIAVVDMGRVMTAHPRTAVNRSILEKELKEFKDERDVMMKRLTEKREKFDKTRKDATSKALSEDARATCLAEAEEQLVGLRDYQSQIQENAQERQKQLIDHRKRMGMKVLEGVSAVIEKYSKKKEIDIVIDSIGASTSGIGMVLYASDEVDITDDIVALVEKIK